MQLNAQQLAEYKTFGFILIPAFLSHPEVEALREAVSKLKAKESGEPDTIKHTGRVIGMFHKDPLLRDLFDDVRLHAIAEQLLGVDRPIRFLGDEYVSYSAPADWHQDMVTNESFESLKFGFYLDDLSRGGCLRVVPGSHRSPLAEDIAAVRSSAKPSPELACAHPCMTQPGDLLVFNLKLWHQGTANPPGTHRRVIFWSVGQDDPKFTEFAAMFHDRVGRGKTTEPWPAAMLENAPRRRLDYLNLFPADSPKRLQLAELTPSA